MKIADCKGKLQVGFAPHLDGLMIVGRDCSLLYEVLEEVRTEELRCKGRPRGEGWIAEEELASSGDEEWINVRSGTEGQQFQIAQEDDELQEIRETQVAPH